MAEADKFLEEEEQEGLLMDFDASDKNSDSNDTAINEERPRARSLRGAKEEEEEEGSTFAKGNKYVKEGQAMGAAAGQGEEEQDKESIVDDNGDFFDAENGNVSDQERGDDDDDGDSDFEEEYENDIEGKRNKNKNRRKSSVKSKGKSKRKSEGKSKSKSEARDAGEGTNQPSAAEATERFLSGDADGVADKKTQHLKRKVDESKSALDAQMLKKVRHNKAQGTQWVIEDISDEDRELGIPLWEVKSEEEEEGSKKSASEQKRKKAEAKLDAKSKRTVEPLQSNQVRLDPIFSKVLKPHQAVGVRFLWSHVQSARHGGCVLADYMGLGKTLQNISLMHTFLKNHKDEKNPHRKTTVLIVAPTSVILNWKREIHKWLDESILEQRRALELFNVKVLDTKTGSRLDQRIPVLKAWQREGGVLITGYEMFRSLAQEPKDGNDTNDHQKARDLLVYGPGPSMVIVDEGHRLRHAKSQIVKAMSKLKTRRRVVLTGYPLQNHLEEYWCMVNFARPGFLRSSEVFKHQFKIPIENGQALDSAPQDVALARSRTMVLNDLLRSIILRRDSQHLARELPPKYEWVLRCRLTPKQAELYRAFARNRVDQAKEREMNGGSSQQNGGIIAAYHHSLSIVNHPDILCAKYRENTSSGEGLGSRDNSYAIMTIVVPNSLDSLGIQIHQCMLASSRVDPTETVAAFVSKISNDNRSDPKASWFELFDEIIAVNNDPCGQEAFKETYIRAQSEARAEGQPLYFTVHRWHVASWRRAQFLGKVNSCDPVDVTLGKDELHEADLSVERWKEIESNRKLAEMEDDDGIVAVEESNNEPEHSLSWARLILKSYAPGARLSDSGKMIVLFSILRNARQQNDKVIVFSQSVQTLNMIQVIIEAHNAHVRDQARAIDYESDSDSDDNLDNSEEYAEAKARQRESITPGTDACPYVPGVTLGFSRLDGSTPQAVRNALVDAFNGAPIREKCVFLASTRAAGEGLNLQSANRVVMFDACWNPCLDHEAMCRAYRFGQTKPVYVYRLVAAGTMERTIFDQQTKKESLTSRVVDARATKRTVLAADLRNFFNLKRFNQLQQQSVNAHKLLEDLSDAEEAEGEQEQEQEQKDNGKEETSKLDKEKSSSPKDEAKDPEKDDIEVIDDPHVTEKAMQQKRALRSDLALQAVLRNESSGGSYITEFCLEDLLLNEDEAERQTEEARAQAMAEFREVQRIEQELIKSGQANENSAAAMAASIYAHNMGGNKMRARGIQAPAQNNVRHQTSYMGNSHAVLQGLHAYNQMVNSSNQTLPYQEMQTSGQTMRNMAQFQHHQQQVQLQYQHQLQQQLQQLQHQQQQQQHQPLQQQQQQGQQDQSFPNRQPAQVKFITFKHLDAQYQSRLDTFYISKRRPVLPDCSNLFEGLTILVIRKRMPVAEEIMEELQKYGAKPTTDTNISCQFVISTLRRQKLSKLCAEWQLKSDEHARASNTPQQAIRSVFKKPEWVSACIHEKRLLPGYQPEESELSLDHAPSSSHFSKPGVPVLTGASTETIELLDD